MKISKKQIEQLNNQINQFEPFMNRKVWVKSEHFSYDFQTVEYFVNEIKYTISKIEKCTLAMQVQILCNILFEQITLLKQSIKISQNSRSIPDN